MTDANRRFQMNKTVWILFGLLLTLPMAARAQSDDKRQAQARQTIVMDIRMTEADAAATEALDKRARDQRQFDNLISEGKARVVAEVELMTTAGHRASAHIGQSVPIQTAAVPVAVRQEPRSPSDRDQRDQTATAALRFGVPQIQYQNTGISVSATPTRIAGGKISVALSLTLSDFNTSVGLLTPVFVNRDINSTVTIGDGETATLMNALQRDRLAVAGQQPARASLNGGTRFLILLGVHSVD
jgi:Flp pilus assembly secretin CpaC